MKKCFLVLLLAVAAGAQAQQKQSLKDLLYGGKLKSDSNSVVRKSDDLSTKIDTAAKKAPQPETPKPVATAADGALTTTTPAGEDAATATPAADATANTEGSAKTASAKSNTKIWKEYTDSLASSLKTEVLPSKKIKKDTYYLMVEYEIGTDGAVSVLNVVSTPENSFLQDAVKSQMTVSPPQLQPAMDSNNKPRKVKRKQNFSITKE